MSYGGLTQIEPGDLLADAAYDQLSEAILRNRLPPGASLSVPELSRQLGISRSPVREAVQRLIYDGLADYRGRRGTVVSSIDIGDFLRLLEVRSVLEGLAAGLAAERGSDGELELLEAHHRRFLDLGTGEAAELSAFVELDIGFHRLLREMSRNPELATLLARTQARAHLSMHRLWSGGRNTEAAKAEHTEICEAVLARDRGAADAAARRHIEALRERALHATVAQGEAAVS